MWQKLALLYNQYRNSDNCIQDLLPQNFTKYKYLFIAVYCCLFLIGAIENISSLISLIARHRRNVANTILLIQLTVANMIVTFAIIPIEIVWRITVSWPTGSIGCKLLQTVRAFGPYLSSFCLMAISLDRYFVLTSPFCTFRQSRLHTRVTIAVIWAVSILLSLPQGVIFSLEQHHDCTKFVQCVPFNYFSMSNTLKIYNIAALCFLCIIPLAVITYCYFSIIMATVRQSQELQRMYIPDRDYQNLVTRTYVYFI